MRKISFIKMHGAGNDFVVIDVREGFSNNPSKTALHLCNRHFGIGSDGLIVINNTERADCRMIFFNPDGTRDVCGNGMRCVAKFLYDESKSRRFTIEIDTGLVSVDVLADGTRFRIGMGKPELVREHTLEAVGREWNVRELNTGTHHAVTFVDDVSKTPVHEVGEILEIHPAFREHVSVDFVQVVSRNHLKIRIWERSAGETLACGTGACASLVTSVLAGKTDRRASVESPGGVLEVEWEQKTDELHLTGPAEEVFRGDFEL